MVFEIDREMCIVAVSLLLLAKIWQSGRYFKAYQKSEQQNKIYLAMGLLFLLLFFGRLVYAFSDFYLPYMTPLPTEDQITNWGKLGGMLDALGVGVLFFLLENQQFHGKDKYFFFIGYLTFVSLYIMTPDRSIAATFMIIAQFFNGFLVFILLNMIIKYKGEVRKRSIMILLGWALFIVGTLMTNDDPIIFLQVSFGVSFYIVDIIAYAIKIVGVTVLAKGYL